MFRPNQTKINMENIWMKNKNTKISILLKRPKIAFLGVRKKHYVLKILTKPVRKFTVGYCILGGGVGVGSRITQFKVPASENKRFNTPMG